MTTDRFYTKRLTHSSGTFQLMDNKGILKIMHLPEDDVQQVCDALNLAERPQITPERMADFAKFVAPASWMLPSPGREREVFGLGFDHALFILRERFELGES